TPKQVQNIAKEFVLRDFGEKAQAVIATHIDKEHIHAHIILNTYALDGQKFNSNWAAVQRARDMSDNICIERGIMPIMLKFNYEKGNNYTYGEWKHRKQGTSWKARIAEYIDSLIPLAKDLDGLLKIMEGHGYVVRRGMYISVKAPGQQRAIRLHKLGIGYSEEELINRINAYLVSQPKELSLDEIFRKIGRKFAAETRNICFAAGVKDTVELTKKQIALINTEHITYIGEAEGLLEQTQKKITELETAITDFSAEIQHKQIVTAAAERYFGKPKIGAYSASQKKSDKLILANSGVKALTDVSEYADDVAADNARLTEMQSELEAFKQREAVLQSIIKTYGDRDDYVSKMVKAAHAMLDEQEQEKVKRSQSKMITVYKPISGREIPRDTANIDDYTIKHQCSLYDLPANPDDLQEVLTELNKTHTVNDGDVVVFDDENTGYYSEGTRYWHLANFMSSRREIERQRQEELDRQEQEHIEAEERQRQQEEEQRRKEEEKAKQQTITQKKGSKPMKH
ncbi:MAG: relaxase/mobilization nuclease domain-containing protein, partial [Ruminiclostridium sp.]|nr:relaxase/mobilization nuclease domain-containing protein [Ruminiclostridium sp.]